MEHVKNISSNKIFAHLDRVKEIIEYNRCFPICLEIHPTNYCTHNCNNCTAKKNRTTNIKDAMTSDLIFNILEDFNRNGGKAILWSGGGDPALYSCPETGRKLNDVIDYCGNLKIDQGVYSNGEHLNHQMIESIVKNCTFLRISLDAFSPQTHKRVHNVDSFNIILKNIAHCLEIKNELGSQIDIGISYVVYENNIADLTNFKSFLNNYPVDYLYFKPGVIIDASDEAKNNQRAGLLEIRENLKEYNQKTQIEIADKKFENIVHSADEYKKSCYIGALFPLISADAKLFYCCHTVNNVDFLIGDLKEEALYDISKRFQINRYCNFKSCPVNCRGHIINNDVESAICLLTNRHKNFL
jgi:sulfatase maturation enzyme AslB (radical SAM superfamily)